MPGNPGSLLDGGVCLRLYQARRLSWTLLLVLPALSLKLSHESEHVYFRYVNGNGEMPRVEKIRQQDERFFFVLLQAQTNGQLAIFLLGRPDMETETEMMSTDRRRRARK